MIAHTDVWMPGADRPLEDWALNDITLERVDRGRMVELSIRVDDVEMSSFGCDGVIVSTPTGSTAYAFSAGGPIIWPNVKALQLVPNAAHALFARPLIIGSHSTFTLDILEESSTNGWICCDGRRQRELPKGTRVQVRESRNMLRLARLSGAPFTSRLVSKFDLPVVGWREQARKTGDVHHGQVAVSWPSAAKVVHSDDADRCCGTCATRGHRRKRGLIRHAGGTRNPQSGAHPIGRADARPGYDRYHRRNRCPASRCCLNAIRLISGAAADANRVSSGADAAWAQGVFMAGPQTAAAAIAAEAGVEPEDGELFLARSVPASGRSRATANGRSVTPIRAGPHHRRTGHGARAGRPAAHRLRRQTARVPGRRGRRPGRNWPHTDRRGRRWRPWTNGWRNWPAKSPRSGSRPTTYANRSSASIGSIRSRGRTRTSRIRRSRIENAAEIAQGVGGALGALDASAVDGDPDALGASDLITRAVQHLRAIHVEGPFSDLADRLESIGADLSDVVFSLSRQIDMEEGRRRSGRDQRAHPRARRADPPLGADPGRRNRLA